jgi:hypothetical protein
MFAAVRKRVAPVVLLIGAFALPAAAQAPAAPLAAKAVAIADGSRDFDFEFGEWKMHLKRRLRPLTGSTEWVEYTGISKLWKVWGGAANVGEIDLKGPAGRIQGMTVRLYNPQTGQWNVTFASIDGAELGRPMVGGFSHGRGEFYNQETLDGRAIFVRFVISDIARNSFRFEQAFSADGGKTWEVNWISTFSRIEG